PVCPYTTTRKENTNPQLAMSSLYLPRKSINKYIYILGLGELLQPSEYNQQQGRRKRREGRHHHHHHHKYTQIGGAKEKYPFCLTTFFLLCKQENKGS
uniref:Uncharacterized protein n=1 Tax=Aegilops tauschii subsp. strangulata TaxID=200361 RepID=A0A453RMX7_AEGTS